MNIADFVQSYADNTIGNRTFYWTRLPADGSRKIFYRLRSDRESYIIMINPPVTENAEKENLSFLKIGNHLFEKKIPVACIYKYDLANGWFIIEDLGTKDLQTAFAHSHNIIPLYKKIIELLIHMQFEGRKGFNLTWCYHTKKYDRFIMERFESDYFLTYFLKGIHGLTQGLDELKFSFKHLSYNASRADNNFFLHRDFQSRNLMVKDNKIGVIDWQGGRLGPLQYDLASLLIDPYVMLKNEEQMVLYDYYMTLLVKRLSGISTLFSKHYPYIAVQRNLQILGAFSYLSKVQGKSNFLSYISPSLQSLDFLLRKIGDPQLDALKKIVESLNG
jgi:N-acetylmuramate 1-kinase